MTTVVENSTEMHHLTGRCLLVTFDTREAGT